MRLPTALLGLLLFVWASPSLAQNPIHRCIAANGSPVFTDQPCDVMGASTAQRAEKPASQTTEQPATLPILCASTLPDLQQSVVDAFARQDANRLAGLMLWQGYGRSAATTIRALAAAMRRPLLGFDAADAYSDPWADYDDPPRLAPSTLELHLGGVANDDSPSALRFAIVQRYGCLWLRLLD